MLYQFGDCSLDTARFELTRDGTVVEVEPLALRLLTFLIENRDRVVTRDELHTRFWGRRVVTDNALNVSIRSARLAVGDSGGEQSIIRTVRGAGYQFVADLEISSQQTVGALREAPDSERHSVAARTEPARTEPASRAQPALVVLPFENVGGDRSAGVVASGLVHDLITRIARSRAMFIIARGTAFKFPSGRHDVRKIGQKLGVRYVVQGAVQISGTRMKVSVSLANALTRQELWSEQFNRSLDDFMRVQEEISDLIVASLESQIQREEMRRSLLMPSTNLDAWSAYHRGLHYMYRFKPADCDKAEQLLRRSIDMEPNVPRPYAALSFINFERVFMHFVQDRPSTLRKAFDYALQSLAIDPLDPMGHWALSRAYLLRAELEASRSSLSTAIELNPSYAIAQYSLGWVAMQLGENELCNDRIGLAQRLSPYDPLKFAMLGVTGLNLAMMGRTQEGAALAVQSTLQPNAHYQVMAFAAVTHALDGQLDRARSLFSRTRAVSPGYDLKDFLSVFPFRKEHDIERVTKAFQLMRPRSRSH